MYLFIYKVLCPLTLYLSAQNKVRQQISYKVAICLLDYTPNQQITKNVSRIFSFSNITLYLFELNSFQNTISCIKINQISYA